MTCPLCSSGSRSFFSNAERTYLECSNCRGIFVRKEDLPDPVSERERYLSHNNDVEDIRYQKFVSPIVEAVRENYNVEEHLGLDFGAGTGPVITKLLTDLKFRVFPYDPYFLPHSELLKRSYDFIVCCEVIEHFQNPAKEFELLRSLLLNGGELLCMTGIYHPEICFDKWYYKNDPTHVFIYQEETLYFIGKKFGFREVRIDNRLIIFRR